MMLHVDSKLMRGAASRTYVFCWVCMRVTNATLWPVVRRTRVMLLPVGAGQPQWNDVQCDDCRSLYKMDALAPAPQSEADLPNAAALIDRVQRGALSDENRVALLVRVMGDLQYMLWKKANDGRIESVTTMLSLVFIILLIASCMYWFAYFDPRARSPRLLAIASALSAATIGMFVWVARRSTRRNAMGLNAGVLDRLVIAASHLGASEQVVEEAIDQLAQTAPRYAKDLRRVGLVERIMNPCDTLRP